MNSYTIIQKMFQNVLTLLIICLALMLASSTAFGHGPKGHAEGNFTSLQAVKKGVELYDRLVAKGKLSGGWETGLKRIDVSTRATDKKKEIVVEFIRDEGEPKSVYIFFSQKGEYKGSNFTGK